MFIFMQICLYLVTTHITYNTSPAFYMLNVLHNNEHKVISTQHKITWSGLSAGVHSGMLELYHI